jgi:hypothetical protein
MDAVAESYFTVQEIAELWKLSPVAVRRLFLNEPGVLVLGRVETRRLRRVYRTLRIPASALSRVRERLANHA